MEAILAREREEFENSERKETTFVRSGIHIDYKYHDFDIAGMIEGLAPILPFALVEELSEHVTRSEQPVLYYASAFSKMVDRLKFRRDMHREFDT